MTADARQDAADRLWDAAVRREPCLPVREGIADLGLAGAYQVQQLNVDRAVAAGRRVVGRKIGLTAAVVQRQLGVSQPDFGTLLDDMCFGDGEPIAFDRLLQPRVEAEVAFVLGRPLRQPAPTVADVLRAVEYVLPAIEVVDSRVEGWNITIHDTIADNASSGVFVLGLSPVKLDGLDLRLAGMTMRSRGDEVSTGAGAACLGNPLIATTWLARQLSALGTPLDEGDIVLSGALGPVVPVAPGRVYEAEISGLGSVRATFGPEGER